MPGADTGHDFRQVGSHLLAPPVLLLQLAQGRSDERQQRPFLPRRETRVEFAPRVCRVGVLPLRDRGGVLRLALEVRADREQRRRRIFVQPRQRPVGLVVAAMPVYREKSLEPNEERRAGERGAKVDKGAVVGEQVRPRRRIEPRDLGEGDEIHGLLRADRASARRQLRIDQAIVGEARRLTRAADHVLVDLHAAHHEYGVHRVGHGRQPPIERRRDVSIRQRVWIAREARQNRSGVDLVRPEHAAGAQRADDKADKVRQRQQETPERWSFRDFVFRRDVLGVPERAKGVCGRGAHGRRHVPQLR